MSSNTLYKIKPCVIGLGYTGLPLLNEITKYFKQYIGYDINKELIDKIRINKLKVSNNIKDIEDFNFYIICVPTPLDKYKNPDTSYIQKAFNDIKVFLKNNDTIVLESTTYPGTTRELILRNLKNKKINVGYSPERIDPGNKMEFNLIPKIISANNKRSLKIILNFYQTIFKSVQIAQNFEEAEFAKLYENIYRVINISLANEMKMIAKKMNINHNNIIELAASKPYGFTKFLPGPGIGGHCIPVDPFYLTWKAKEFGMHTKFIELAGEINDKMPDWVINQIQNYFNKKKIVPSHCLLVGLSYKKNISDMRESPSIKLFQNLMSEMILKCDYHDPLNPTFKINKKIYKSVNINKIKTNNYDFIIICTDHDIIDYKKLEKLSDVIFDTRNRIKISKAIQI